MSVAALILGILSLAVFSWGGPVLAAFLSIWGTATSAVGASLGGGQVAIPSWPLYVFGWGFGVVVPTIAIALSVVAIITSKEAKAAGIAGVVTSFLGAIIGLGIMALAIWPAYQFSKQGLEMTKSAVQNLQSDPQAMKNALDQLNALSQQMQQLQQQQPQPPVPTVPTVPATPTPVPTVPMAPAPQPEAPAPTPAPAP